MTDSTVEITTRARAILAFDEELNAIEHRIAEERARHSKALADEAKRFDKRIEVYMKQRQTIEQVIFQIGNHNVA